MHKVFLVSFVISIFGILNAAEMSIDISEKIDISLTPYEAEIGTLHPLSRTIEELRNILEQKYSEILKIDFKKNQNYRNNSYH